MRGIQKALNVSFNKRIYFKNIEHWIKNSNRILEEEKQRRKEKEEYLPNDNSKPKNIPIVEMDELFTYIKKTKKFNYRKTPPNRHSLFLHCLTHYQDFRYLVQLGSR